MTKKFEKQIKITWKVVIPTIKLFHDEKRLKYAQINCWAKILCEKNNATIMTNQTDAGRKCSKSLETFFLTYFSKLISHVFTKTAQNSVL